LLYFFPATSGSLIISPDDGVIQNIPFRVAVANMIRSGYAPLWNPYLFCGMPLFAAAQAGILFPLNWFYLVFPPAAATNLMMLSTYMVAALGAYLYARRSGASIAGAAVTSLIWQCGGFMVNQVSHTNIAHTAALLPWLLWAIDGYGRTGDGRRGLLLALLVALQCFAGHQQTFAYSLFLAAAYAAVLWRVENKAFYRSSLLFLGAGLALAAVQILPTLELLRHSLRADATYDFFTSFSMPPGFIWTFFAPYLMGGGDGLFFRAPYVGPSFYAEYVGYVGQASLVLAIVAMVFYRDARTKFWAAVAVVGLVLALGRYAPFGFYKLVYTLPILNLFRVPARHLMEVEFGLAVLAGRGLTALLEANDRAAAKRAALIAGVVVVGITCLAITLGRPADFRLGREGPVSLLRAPELFLPPILAALSARAVWLAARRKTRTSVLFLFAVLLFDLVLWGQFSGWRVTSPTSQSELLREPAVFKFLREQAAGSGTNTKPSRILTQDHFFDPTRPVSYAAPVATWSLPLQPDIAMMHSLENAAGYEGFGVGRYSKLAGDMKVWGDLTDPERTLRGESRELDLLNVRYLLVRADARTTPKSEKEGLTEVREPDVFGTEKFATGNLNLGGIVAGEQLTFTIPPTETDRIALLTALAWGENAPDKAIVAQVRVYGSAGETAEFQLRAGEHTAEWAHDRPDIQSRIKHSRAPVATSYEVKDGNAKFDGHDYVAGFSLPRPMTIVRGEIVVQTATDALRLMLTVNRLSLAREGRTFAISPERITKQAAPAIAQVEAPRWTRLGEVERVAVFENSRALPRAWLAAAEKVGPETQHLEIIRSGRLPDGSAWNPMESVLVESALGLGETAPAQGRAEITRHEPNRVEVKTESVARSILVLADNFYPGWRAKVDGRRAKISRVNYNQRGVIVPAGSHTVSFVYQPKSVLYGLIISVAALLVLIWWARRFGGRKGALLARPRFVDRLEDCFFYHVIELPGLGVIPAHWDLRGRFDDYLGGVSVAGKSVLDVGTATGFLSFESEKRGATRVLSFDQADGAQQKFLPFKDNPFYRDHPRWAVEYRRGIEKWKNAYWLSHRLLNSKAEVFYGDIYDLPVELGQFDVAIVGSVLEHLNDPVTALGSIARLTRETMIIVTPLWETDERVARFEGRANEPGADFTWWTYSTSTYREVLGMLGFTIAKISKVTLHYAYADRYEERSVIVAVREASSARQQ
jgi:SAM-dependent methyltransferase